MRREVTMEELRTHRRWIALADLQRKLREQKLLDVTARTLQRWCRAKRLPAKRMMACGLNEDETKRGGRFQWVIDLHELKSGSNEGRQLYEELFAPDDD